MRRAFRRHDLAVNGRLQRRIECKGEIARGARTEAEKVEAFHRDQLFLCRGGRGRERRMLEHGFCIQSKRSALHCQDRVRTRSDHGLVIDQLVALVFGDGVGGSGERDDAVGSRRTSRHHGPSVHEGQNEQRPAWALDACAQCGQSAKVSLHQFDQAFAALGRSGRLRDQPDFLDDTVAGEPVGDLHEGHRRGLQHCDRVLGTRALGSEDQGRTEAEHAFGRQLTYSRRSASPRAHAGDKGSCCQRR
jgi:hypothetical protein